MCATAPRTGCVVLAVLGLAGNLSQADVPGIPDGPTATRRDEAVIAQCLTDLKSRDGQVRVAATKELFRRGKSILPALQRAGGRNLFRTYFAGRPTRLDMVVTVLDPPAPIDRGGVMHGTFRLNLREGTTADEVARLAKKYDLAIDDRPKPRVPDRGDFKGPTLVVSCNARDVVPVLRELLGNEPGVESASLCYAW